MKFRTAKEFDIIKTEVMDKIFNALAHEKFDLRDIQKFRDFIVQLEVKSELSAIQIKNLEK